MMTKKGDNTSQPIRIFIVEDTGKDRRALRDHLDKCKRQGTNFQYYLYGDHPNESYDDPQVVNKILEHIRTHQNDYDVIVLDPALNGDEQNFLRQNSDLPRDKIASLSNENCPGSFRILRLLRNNNRIPIVIWTWHDYTGWRDHAMQDLGADWAMPKDLDRINRLGDYLREVFQAGRRLRALDLDALKGRSPAITDLRNKIRRFVHSSLRQNLLVVGPSGAGKELVAEVIGTALSLDGKFLRVNSAYLDDNSADAELGGVKDGAFSEVDAREGFFVEAQNGVVYLDEIATLSRRVQDKMLRMLESKEIIVKGENQRIMLDNVSVISATNSDMRQMIEDGSFREDLYGRLASAVIHVPPLNEHREDIPDIAQHFLIEAEKDTGRYYLDFEPAVLDTLMRQDWSFGNVRTLRNCVFTAVRELVARGGSRTLTIEHINAALANPKVQPPRWGTTVVSFAALTSEGVNLNEELAQLKQEHKKQYDEHLLRRGREALALGGRNNKRKAQSLLQIDPQRWYDLFERYGLLDE